MAPSRSPVASRIEAEREPGGGEAGRGLHHLRQNIGGRGRIAALQIIQRPLVAPVGDQIAG